MKIKKFYQRDETGALVMKNGAVVSGYIPKTKIFEFLPKIKKFVKNIADLPDFLAMLKFNEDVIALAIKEKWLEIVGGEVSINHKNIGLSINDEPVLTGIQVQQLPKNGIQHFAQGMIDEFLEIGVLSIAKKVLTLNTIDGPISFNIKRVPGFYCCHSGKKLAGEKEARKHVKEHYCDIDSPCSQNPSGYEKTNHYVCEVIIPDDIAKDGEG